MCANAPPTSSPFVSNGRSFLSRLASPLKSRNRNLTDFHIKPLEPHRQYSPGDIVKGAVILRVVKPIRITHLTVCLHGFVRVFKNPNVANDPLPVDTGLTASNNARKSQYFGNGHASLFQDEQTLCGDGRLDAGHYEFNFELEFPSKGLPTSIDFERGTISYMITSTITRPTSIAATSTCDQKVSLIETVDIGFMTPPKPRTISLEPISRRTRRKKTSSKIKEVGPQEVTDARPGTDNAQMTGSPHPDESASQRGSVDHNTNPRSFVPSDILSTVSAATGTESTTSSSTGLSFRLGPVPSSAKSSSRLSSKASLTDKTITATVELQRSGCLPGENLPLKISIKHTKAIKSMHGIIITLYRQGRIDSAPPLSLFVDAKGKAAEKLKHEEYYPKSKTGLGGLSLTSAGSSSLFRKDLAQTFAPILVDPVTLTVVVNASVRVPEDVFPTISGVPGEMISFKYHIEVVIDLGGKLAAHQRHVPRVGTVSLTSSFGTSNGRGDGNPGMLTAWGGGIVETDHIRREKSVVVCLFEIIVGSTDSARKRRSGNSLIQNKMTDWPEEALNSPNTTHDQIYGESVGPTGHEEQFARDHQPPYQYYDQNYEQQYPEYYLNEGYDYDPNYDGYSENHPQLANSQIHVPSPEVQDEESLNEKERARLAEERLLPSQPPQGPSSSRTVIPPVAPFVLSDENEDLYNAEDSGPRIPLNALHLEQPGSSFDQLPGPSAPTLEDLTTNLGAHSMDDKQELERQRMLTEASAPLDFRTDEDDNGGEGSSGQQHESSAPSAPVFENDEYVGQYYHPNLPSSTNHDEDVLPEYKR